MSNIKKLIAQLEWEDNKRHEVYRKLKEEQNKEFDKLRNEVDYLKDETAKYINDIIKNLKQLLSNKSTIEKMLEQSNDPVGLPIPYYYHESTVDLVSKVAEFINNSSNQLDRSKIILPSELFENLINSTENVVQDLKECHTEVTQVQTLYLNCKCLKAMIEDYTNNKIHKLDDSNYQEILE